MPRLKSVCTLGYVMHCFPFCELLINSGLGEEMSVR